MQYKYDALDAHGKKVSDTIEADSTSDAIALIMATGLFPTKVKESKDKEGIKNTSIISKLPTLRLNRPLTTMEKVMMAIISLQLIIITGLAILKIWALLK